MMTDMNSPVRRGQLKKEHQKMADFFSSIEFGKKKYLIAYVTTDVHNATMKYTFFISNYLFCSSSTFTIN